MKINLQESSLNILWFYFYFLKSTCQLSYSCVYCIFYGLFLCIFLHFFHSFFLLFFLPPTEMPYLVIFLRNTQIVQLLLQMFHNLLRAFTRTFKDWCNKLYEYAAESPLWRDLETTYFRFIQGVFPSESVWKASLCLAPGNFILLHFFCNYLHVRHPLKQEKNVRVREGTSPFPLGIMR